LLSHICSAIGLAGADKKSFHKINVFIIVCLAEFVSTFKVYILKKKFGKFIVCFFKIVT